VSDDDLWFRRSVSGAATHALVIGTSAYPYRPFGLTDLGPAAVSARNFATWVRDRYRRPDAPVATIRMLLAPPAGEENDTPLPTRAAVLNALAAWRKACFTDPGNVAILYLCGYGAQETDDSAVVFTHDAGAQQAEALDEAIDVAGVRAAMTGPTAPHRQWYFVDVCRVPASELTAIDAPLRGGITLDPGTSVAAPLRPLFYAAAAGGAPAYGSGAGTVFHQALMEALDRAGGGWAVTATSLLESVSARVATLAGRGLVEQKVVTSGLGDQTLVDGPAPAAPATSPVAAPGRPDLRQAAEIRDGQGTEIRLPGPDIRPERRPWSLQLCSAEPRDPPEATVEPSGGLRLHLAGSRRTGLIIEADGESTVVLAPASSDLVVDAGGRALPAASDAAGRDVLTAAARLVEEGRLAAACLLLQQAQASSGLTADGATLLGFVAVALNRPEIARSLLQLAGRSADANALRAALYARAGHLGTALPIVARVLDQGPPALSMAVAATLRIARSSDVNTVPIRALRQLSRRADLGNVLFSPVAPTAELRALLRAAWNVDASWMLAVPGPP
jgi:hypothetical protein